VTTFEQLTVLVINTRTGRSQERTLIDLKPICTGDDYQSIISDLKESGISESLYSRIELI